MVLVEGLIILGTILYILYRYGTSTYDYWEKRGVDHIKAYLPFLGSNGERMFWKRQTMMEGMWAIYNAFPGQKFVGVYLFRKPVLFICDPELIKNITIKDFDHFYNRSSLIDSEMDPIFGNSLVALKDQEWKDMRHTLSPVFTGAKMRNMFILVNKCGEQVTNYLDSEMKRQVENNHPDRDTVTLEMKTFFRCFANDVIATTAFGIQIDSLKDPKNEFYIMGENLNNFLLLTVARFFLFLLIPSIMKALKLSLFGEKVHNFFRKLVTENIKIREEQNIVRPDLIHILMSARKGTLTDENNQIIKIHLTDDEMTAQAMLFFFGGFEQASVTLSFLAHELAVNPDIQRRLQEEIDRIIEEDNGITYEGVMHKMKYLDAAVNETLRKWTPSPAADRLVTKRYVIPKTENSPEVVLEKGDLVWIPIMGLHQDPKYFPDPEKFNPERFIDENKNKLVPFTFLPFGSGPRNCIGMRLALMQIKACVAYLLHKYSFVPVPKTQIPLRISKSPFQLNAEKGFWLGIKPRSSQL